jgi:hypothetical protein
MTGGARAEVARTSRDRLWTCARVRLWRYRWDARCYVAPVLIVHTRVSKSYVLDLLSNTGIPRFHVGDLADGGFSDDQAHRRGRSACEPLSGPVERRVRREASGHGPPGSRSGAVPPRAVPSGHGVGGPTERASRGRLLARPWRGPADRHHLSALERVCGARHGRCGGILEPLIASVGGEKATELWLRVGYDGFMLRGQPANVAHDSIAGWLRETK